MRAALTYVTSVSMKIKCQRPTYRLAPKLFATTSACLQKCHSFLVKIEDTKITLFICFVKQLDLSLAPRYWCRCHFERRRRTCVARTKCLCVRLVFPCGVDASCHCRSMVLLLFDGRVWMELLRSWMRLFFRC